MTFAVLLLQMAPTGGGATAHATDLTPAPTSTVIPFLTAITATFTSTPTPTNTATVTAVPPEATNTPTPTTCVLYCATPTPTTCVIYCATPTPTTCVIYCTTPTPTTCVIYCTTPTDTPLPSVIVEATPTRTPHSVGGVAFDSANGGSGGGISAWLIGLSTAAGLVLAVPVAFDARRRLLRERER